ncbi:hypothetical protein BDZ89DRAFT_959832, partial [Hymenopellis radicata]
QEILPIADFSLATFYRVRKCFHSSGDVAKAEALGRGRPQSIAEIDAHYLLSLCRTQPTTFLDEYRERLHRYRHLPVSMTTIHRFFIRHGINLKCVQKMASERSPGKRADCVRRLAAYPASYIVSTDEVSKDDRTYARMMGRDGIFAARVVEGSFDRERFIRYLRDDVVCACYI